MGLAHACLQIDDVPELILAVARLIPLLPNPVENFDLIAVRLQWVEIPLDRAFLNCHGRMQSVVY